MFKKLRVKKPQFKAPQRNVIQHIGKKGARAKNVDDLSWLDSLGGIGGGMKGSGEPGGSEEAD